MDKKLHGHGHGYGGQGQQAEACVIEATGQDASGRSGGEYGYGEASRGYGFGLGDASGNAGDFEWAGAREATGWFGDLDLDLDMGGV